MKEYRTNEELINYLSSKAVVQILKNLTTIRNVAAHSDRLYNYTSKLQ